MLGVPTTGPSVRLAKHDVYDATSRSVEIALPETLKKEPSFNFVEKQLLPLAKHGNLLIFY